MIDPTNCTADDIAASLARSEAQLAAGDTVPMAPAMKRLRDGIAQLEAKQRGPLQREATPAR